MTTEAQAQGLGEFVRWGFTLEHLGCEVVMLVHEGELIGRFYQTGATEASLQEECSKHLVTKHGWEWRLLIREEANDILASIKPSYKYGPAELPEFREYAHRKYTDALDEDLITMIEDLIQRGQGDKDH